MSVKNLFIEQRKHQMKIANSGGGALTVFPSGRTELTFASAPFGRHAISAFRTAKFLASHGKNE